MDKKCPQCHREVSAAPGTATYSCRVPGCLAIRLCCPHCLGKHYGAHVAERDWQNATLRTSNAELEAERDALQATVDTMFSLLHIMEAERTAFKSRTAKLFNLVVQSGSDLFRAAMAAKAGLKTLHDLYGDKSAAEDTLNAEAAQAAGKVD